MGKFIFLIVLLTICRFSIGNRCSSDEFDCGTGECIAHSWICDGTFDCVNYRDEMFCDHVERKCGSRFFKCKSIDICIQKISECDGTADCEDQSDEMNCEGRIHDGNKCASNQFKCKSEDRCIQKTLECDGVADCRDQSDETNCGERIYERNECASDQFKCESDNQCIPGNLKCNGEANCNDISDEMHCEGTAMEEKSACLISRFKCAYDNRCLPDKYICDGWEDCIDRSDEKRCVDTCDELACSQDCEFSSNISRCLCYKGFELDKRDKKTCTDIDECLLKSTCSQKCINTLGSYRCECYDGYEMINEKTCVKFGIKDSEFIFFNNGSNIYVKKRKDGYELLDLLPLSSRIVKITGLSFQPKMEVLYIAHGERPAIYAVNITSLQVQKLVTNHISSPEDIAFDWMNDNLYWVDSNKGTTEVISVNTLKRIVLIEDLSKPVSLTISPHSGTMFIAEVSFEARISMFDMDGKNKRLLHSVRGLPMSLSLHPSETLLYWSNIKEKEISYVNYSNTSPPRTLQRVEGLMSVAVGKNEIFYTSEDLPPQSEEIPVERVHEIKLQEYRKNKNWKSITYSYDMKPSRMPQCLFENGGCSYLCLTSPMGRTCACPSGMKLDVDKRTCVGANLS